MASILLASRFWSESDLRKLRRLLGWQSLGYDGRVRCRAVPLEDLWSGEFNFFTSYALSGLVLLFSSFFTLLKWYGLQLHHLSLHSITLVVIFVCLCEMYVGMRLLVCLFSLFHVLRSSRKRASPIGSYHFQHRTKGLVVYIAALTPSKWDHRRNDWVIMQAEIHDRLELPTAVSMGRRNGWEKVPDLQPTYLLMLKRIQFLAENSLTSMMVLFNFFSKRNAPLQLCARPAWIYTGENDAT
jgi:hypothetical protein